LSAEDTPQRLPQEQFALKPWQIASFKPSANKKTAGSSICSEPSILATTMVQHHGGSWLYTPSNQHKNVLDSIDSLCYP
jgi:hypothetical protein